MWQKFALIGVFVLILFGIPGFRAVEYDQRQYQAPIRQEQRRRHLNPEVVKVIQKTQVHQAINRQLMEEKQNWQARNSAGRN